MARETPTKSAKVAKKAVAKRVAAKPALLSGDNPQIAKADGEAPVQAYIAAMPARRCRWLRAILHNLHCRCASGWQKNRLGPKEKNTPSFHFALEVRAAGLSAKRQVTHF